MSKNIAVITGANSGIGKEFTKILSTNTKIDEIWAIARNQERLNELRRDLGDKIRIFSMDLKERGNLSVIKQLLDNEKPNILYLVNCAGYAIFGDYSDASVEASIAMVDLNINALMSMCITCIPHMLAGAHIINMSSQASFQPVPFQNVYSATKAFVRSYTRALNVELKAKGICATAVCPGWMNTKLIDRASIGARRGTNKFPFIVDPYPVAEKALKDADKNKDISVYGIAIKLSHVLSKLLPERIVIKVWLMQQNIKA